MALNIDWQGLQKSRDQLRWLLMQDIFARRAHGRSLEYLDKQLAGWRQHAEEEAQRNMAWLKTQDELSQKKALQEWQRKLAEMDDFKRLETQAAMLEQQGRTEEAKRVREALNIDKTNVLNEILGPMKTGEVTSATGAALARLPLTRSIDVAQDIGTAGRAGLERPLTERRIATEEESVRLRGEEAAGEDFKTYKKTMIQDAIKPLISNLNIIERQGLGTESVSDFGLPETSAQWTTNEMMIALQGLSSAAKKDPEALAQNSKVAGHLKGQLVKLVNKINSGKRLSPEEEQFIELANNFYGAKEAYGEEKLPGQALSLAAARETPEFQSLDQQFAKLQEVVSILLADPRFTQKYGESARDVAIAKAKAKLGLQ